MLQFERVHGCLCLTSQRLRPLLIACRLDVVAEVLRRQHHSIVDCQVGRCQIGHARMTLGQAPVLMGLVVCRHPFGMVLFQIFTWNS